MTRLCCLLLTEVEAVVEETGVAEVDEDAKSLFLKSRNRPRSLWLQVVGSDGDALDVAEIGNGIARMNDTQSRTADFSCAETRVVAAVPAALAGHLDGAATASYPARRAPGRTGPSSSAGTW
jgi:hypothetical protein